MYGCKWATPAQVHTVTTLLQRFKACSHLDSDRLVPFVGSGENNSFFCDICPTTGIFLFEADDDWRPRLCADLFHRGRWGATAICGSRADSASRILSCNVVKRRIIMKGQASQVFIAS